MQTNKILTITAIAIAGVVIIAGLFSSTVFGLGCSPVSMLNGWRNLSQNSMMEGGGMMNTMMSQEPQDVRIKIVSSQQVSVDSQAHITLLVLDKNTGKPIADAQVILGLEKGAPMSTMNMIEPMFEAENIGNGKYVATFTVPEIGYYTLHTHVIPRGQTMMSMMNNHMDIGIIAK